MKAGLAGLSFLIPLLGCQAPAPVGFARSEHPKVFLFVTTDCPLANSYAPEISRIVAHYSPLGIEFALVYVDPEVTREAAKQHARDYGFQAELILDASHQMVDWLGIEVTPEAAVLLPDGSMAYRGRIDDRGVQLGRYRAEPTQYDLRESLDAILAGRPVPHPRTLAVGCFIPGRP